MFGSSRCVDGGKITKRAGLKKGTLERKREREIDNEIVTMVGNQRCFEIIV